MSIKSLKDWTIHWAASPHADVALFVVAAAEAVFFPIPPEVLLVAVLLLDNNRWMWRAFVTTVGSVAGALIGYAIGALFYATIGSQIVAFYGLEESVGRATALFAEHDFLAVFIAAFTPIPFKVATITAGLFGASLISLVTASILGRGLRYSLVALLLRIGGARVNALANRYFDVASIVVIALVLASLVVLGVLL